MPNLDVQLPQVPDVEWKDTQFTFNGAWMPDTDPALIGPENFATLQNLRYKDKGLEGINGYVYVNETAITDFVNIRNGFQLKTNYEIPSYNLVFAIDPTDSDQGRVYQNQTAIGSAGNFEANYLWEDASPGLIGRFSDAPQGSIVYCNSEESCIWAGEEKRPAVVFLTTDFIGTNVMDVTDQLITDLDTAGEYITLCANLVTNAEFESGVTGWSALSTASVTQDDTHAKYGTYSMKIVTTGNDQGAQTSTFYLPGSNTDYVLTFWVWSSTDTTIGVKVLDGDGGTLHDASKSFGSSLWTKIFVPVTSVGEGSSAQVILYAKTEAAGTWFIDSISFVKKGTNNKMVIMTTRPIQGATFYVKTANTTASTMSFYYWDGSAWAAVSGGSDGTSVSSKSLAQSGKYSFTSTESTAGLMHFEELYMYAYLMEISAGEADIYSVTVDAPFQTFKDVWDGVYRQPIQFQIWSADHWEDYTLQVNQSSDVNTPVGGQLDGLLSTDYVIVQFEDPTAGMRWTMLGDLVNTAAAVMTVKYWNGTNWASVTNLVDGTCNTGGTKSVNGTGLIRWDKPTDEQKQTLFGTVGYAYKVLWDSTLTGTKGGAAEVMVDLVYGIPTQHTVKPFDFSVLYKNRVFLGSFSAGGQGNRMDFCAANAPDVWNGYDSSDDGRYALYFGNEEPLRCATQLYNRFGSNIFSMLLVFKDGETYVMTGTTPDDFEQFPVSLNTGCPAPLTLATAEMGFEAGEGMQRQVAIWVSHSGPMMFDGAVMQPVRGVDLYFDPTEDTFVNWSIMRSTARGWVDQTYREYNLLLPSGVSATENNTWLVYDLIRKKWFKKDTGTEEFPQSAWPVTYTTGRRGVHGGTDVGKIMELEYGTSWGASYADVTSGAGIEQIVRTGDFFPSNNIWDECLLRKFKLICEKIDSSVNVGINYYADAAEAASNVIWQDADAAIGVNVNFADMDVNSDGIDETQWASSAQAVLSLNLDVGNQRLVRLIQDLNTLGWMHSFEFNVTTTDVYKGWKPVAWGVRYRVERKDETATV